MATATSQYLQRASASPLFFLNKNLSELERIKVNFCKLRCYLLDCATNEQHSHRQHRQPQNG